MRLLIRLAGALALVVAALPLASLAITVAQWGHRWAGGRFNDDIPGLLALLGLLVASGALLGLFGLLGVIAALRCRSTPRGGRTLTIVVFIGALAGAAAGVAGLLAFESPGGEGFLRMLGALLSSGLLLLLISLFGAPRPPTQGTAG